MPEIVRTRRIEAAPEQVWGALADFGAIARWAPNVDHSCLLTGQAEGVGAARRIQAGRMTLVERVSEWEVPTTLGYSVDGLPPIVRSVINSWSIAPIAGRAVAASVSLASNVDAGPRPPQQLVARVIGRRLAAASDELLAGLDRFVTGQGSSAS